MALNLKLDLKNINLEGVLKLPLKLKLAIVLGVVLFFWILYGILVGYPKVTQIQALRKEIEDLTVKRDAKKKDASQLPKLKEEVRNLERALAYSMTVLPNTEEIPSLLDTIQNNVRFHDLELLSFKPEPEAKKDFYAEIPLSLRFSGNYKDIGEFLQTIGRYPRIINVSTISLRDPKLKGNKVVLTAELKAYTYRFLKSEEQPKQQAQTAGQGQKK
ncbi:MAG: type 4a pilus biogenesis protein PilO [Proteobacteria bacterium]|nr:type 4a pilus biogenesis protein PilO [Pseudomonadota bacterium]